MFGATRVAKNSFKEKYAYSGYGIPFDGKGEWSFGNDSAKNLIVFRVGNSPSSHTDGLQNGFLTLGEDPTFGFDESFGASEKTFDINFSKKRQNFV